MTTEPSILEFPGLRHAPEGGSPRWGLPMDDITLTALTVLTAGGSLIAEAAQAAPPAVTWTMVAASAVGCLTLWIKLRHQYLMARLKSEQLTGENAALRAENDTFRAGRPTLPRPSDQ